MNKRQIQKRQRQAEKMLEAVEIIQDWFNYHSSFTFIAKELHMGRISQREVHSALEALKDEAYLRLYYAQGLDGNADAIQCARQWRMGMFADVTSDRDTITNEPISAVLHGMAIQGMMWDETMRRWYSPETMKAMEECKRRNGSRWAQVWYDGAPESEY